MEWQENILVTSRGLGEMLPLENFYNLVPQISQKSTGISTTIPFFCLSHC